MTYFELVSYLQELINRPIDQNNIDYLNNINISLDGERYYRFIEQIKIVITERLNKKVRELREKLISEYLDADTLSIEASNIRDEIKYCQDIVRCKLILPDNQQIFMSTIKSTNNTLVDTLLVFFEDDVRKSILQNLYIMEENV